MASNRAEYADRYFDFQGGELVEVERTHRTPYKGGLATMVEVDWLEQNHYISIPFVMRELERFLGASPGMMRVYIACSLKARWGSDAEGWFRLSVEELKRYGLRSHPGARKCFRWLVDEGILEGRGRGRGREWRFRPVAERRAKGLEQDPETN